MWCAYKLSLYHSTALSHYKTLHTHSPKKQFAAPSLCGLSPTLRVLKIVPSQVNRRSDTLKNSRKADLIIIIIIVNSPILRIFRRLLLFSNE